MKNVTTVFASLLLMASSAALAQENPAFEDVDTDGNGSVNSTELRTADLDIDIEDADTNGDGMLDREEYEAAVSES